MGLFSTKKSNRITEYQILVEVYFHHLEDKVNEHIRNGWQPIGGVSSVLNHSFMQAMVKYK